MTVWHYVHFFETHLFLMTVSVSRHLLVVAATVRCCRWSCTSEHTDAEDNNQIDQYSHSKSVYQHKWYKYSLSFLALISTTETPHPSVPLIKLIALQTLYKQHSYFLSVFFSPSSPSLLETPTQFNNQVSFSAFCCSWESASRRKQLSSYCELNHWVTPAARHWNYWWHFKCFTAKRRLSNESESPHFCP